MAVTLRCSVASGQEWAQLAHSLELSPRQAEIVENLLCGGAAQQIARDLKISVSTVRTHLRRLFQELDIGDRIELILCIFARLRVDTAEWARAMQEGPTAPTQQIT